MVAGKSQCRFESVPVFLLGLLRKINPLKNCIHFCCIINTNSTQYSSWERYSTATHSHKKTKTNEKSSNMKNSDEEWRLSSDYHPTPPTLPYPSPLISHIHPTPTTLLCVVSAG